MHVERPLSCTCPPLSHVRSPIGTKRHSSAVKTRPRPTGLGECPSSHQTEQTSRRLSTLASQIARPIVREAPPPRPWHWRTWTLTSIPCNRGTIRPTAKNQDPEEKEMHGHLQAEGSPGDIRNGVSNYWPHVSGRLRMYAPNYRSAQALQTLIESSIQDGTWKQFKQELAGGKRTIWTVRSFYERFFEEYCKPRLRSLRRYTLSFNSFNAMLREIPLAEVGVLAGWTA